MAVFGKTGFVRKQEILFAKKLLAWKYENSGMELPDDAALYAHAEKVVEQAHVIARKSGKNVLEILNELKGQVRR